MEREKTRKGQDVIKEAGLGRCDIRRRLLWKRRTMKKDHCCVRISGRKVGATVVADNANAPNDGEKATTKRP